MSLTFCGSPCFCLCECGEGCGRVPRKLMMGLSGRKAASAWGRAAVTRSQKGGDPQSACCLTDSYSMSPPWGELGSMWEPWGVGMFLTGLMALLRSRAQALHQMLQRRETVMPEVSLASRVWRAGWGTVSNPSAALKECRS